MALDSGCVAVLFDVIVFCTANCFLLGLVFVTCCLRFGVCWFAGCVAFCGGLGLRVGGFCWVIVFWFVILVSFLICCLDFTCLFAFACLFVMFVICFGRLGLLWFMIVELALIVAKIVFPLLVGLVVNLLVCCFGFYVLVLFGFKCEFNSSGVLVVVYVLLLDLLWRVMLDCSVFVFALLICHLLFGFVCLFCFVLILVT